MKQLTDFNTNALNKLRTGAVYAGRFSFFSMI